MRSGEYYSKGKFLLSGEYFVLYGAKALAVPLKFGQEMQVREIPRAGVIEWETFVRDKPWFKASFQLEDMAVIDSTSHKTALFIRDLLMAGAELQPAMKSAAQGFSIDNHLDFDIRWGLGSSSSLLSNLAYWLEIDPYSLYCRIFQGSGYDVFCARAEGPITFQLLQQRCLVEQVPFNPPFADHLFFVYSGRKQNSQESVEIFRSKPLSEDRIINQVTDLTEALINCTDLEDFISIIRIHEDAISAAIGQQRVKEALFPDFKGEIKSLGAWGGDFVMAASPMSRKEVIEYFNKKNLKVVFSWKDIIY